MSGVSFVEEPLVSPEYVAIADAFRPHADGEGFVRMTVAQAVGLASTAILGVPDAERARLAGVTAAVNAAADARVADADRLRRAAEVDAAAARAASREVAERAEARLARERAETDGLVRAARAEAELAVRSGERVRGSVLDGVVALHDELAQLREAVVARDARIGVLERAESRADELAGEVEALRGALVAAEVAKADLVARLADLEAVVTQAAARWGHERGPTPLREALEKVGAV